MTVNQRPRYIRPSPPITKERRRSPPAVQTITDITCQGDRSFAQRVFERIKTGPGDFPATGKSVRIQGASHGRYAGGKLDEELVFFDAMQMMAQLGLVPDPSAGS